MSRLFRHRRITAADTLQPHTTMSRKSLKNAVIFASKPCLYANRSGRETSSMRIMDRFRSWSTCPAFVMSYTSSRRLAESSFSARVPSMVSIKRS